MIDPLSQMLALLQLENYMFGGLDFGGDWRVQFPDYPGLRCYAITEGTCWLTSEMLSEPVHLHAGACFLLPCGGSFEIGSDPELPARPFLSLAPRPLNGVWLSYQGGGACRGLGGHFDLQGPHRESLVGLLPRLMLLTEADAQSELRSVLKRMTGELQQPQAGGYLMARLLAQQLLIQVLRAHLTSVSPSIGWLAALGDPELGPALNALHAAPNKPWSVAELARQAGMSRTRFALRFKATIGLAPLQYLTRWRMLLAAEALRTGAESLASIAQRTGYASESAFSLAFKREMGVSPRRYGRLKLTSLASRLERV